MKPNDVLPVPCAAWAEKLAAIHSDDLTPSERTALDNHLLTCQACAATQAAYHEMDVRILALPPVAPLAELPLPLRHLLDEQPVDGQGVAVNLDDGTFTSQGNGRTSASQVADKPGKPRPSPIRRWRRIMSLVAATLVVGALIASSLILFTMHQTQVSVKDQAFTIYVASRGSDGTVYAVRPGNGAIEWQHRLGHTLSGNVLAMKDALYTVSSDGLVFALRKSDGVLLWSRQATPPSPAEASNRVPTPNRAIFTDGTHLFLSSLNTVYAIDALDGSMLWSHPISGCQKCSATIVAVTDGMIFSYSDGLYAMRTSDGAIRWHHPEFPYAAQTLVVANGKVYVAQARLERVVVLRASNGQQVNALAFEKYLSFQGDFPMEMVAASGVLYVESAGSDLYTIRTSDDTTVWHKRYSYGSLFGLSAESDGTLYFASTFIFSFSLVNTGQHITPTPNVSRSEPATEVFAINASDGSHRWHWQPAGNHGFASNVLAINGNAYLSIGGHLYAMSGKDATLLWTISEGTNLGTPVTG